MQTAFALMSACNVSTDYEATTYTPPHYCERYAWRATFPGAFLGVLSTLGLLSFLPASLGFNSRFYQLDFVSIIVALVVAFIMHDRLQWYQYCRDNEDITEPIQQADPGIRGSLRRMSQATLLLGQEEHGASAVVEAKGARADADGEQEETSYDHVCRTLLWIVGILSVIVGYPFAILPFYGAKSTTE